MASTDATPVPKKGVAFRCTVPLFDNTGALLSGGLSSLAAKISKDAGTQASTTNTPTEIATNSSKVYLDLTSTEMTADTVAVTVTCTNTNANPTVFVLYPWSSGKIPADLDTIKTQAVTAAAGVTFPTSIGNYSGGTITGNVSGSVGSVIGNVGGSIGSILGITFPTNFANFAITSGGAITAGTVSDKNGYTISGTNTTLDALATALATAHGAGSWITGSGTSTLTQADVRTAVGLAAANLDSQLAAIEAGIGGSGLTGPYTVSLSFVDANNTAVPLVDFAVVGQGLARANVNGVISFGLNAGTFAIVARPTSSVVFPNVSITVTSAGVTQVIAGTAILVPTPGGSTPSM